MLCKYIYSRFTTYRYVFRRNITFVTMGGVTSDSSFSVSTDITNEDSFSFGTISIPGSQVFAKSPMSYAFVNIRPFMPGHSLVSPLRVVKRYKDMTAAELADLSALVQVTAEALEQKHNASACTIVCQDGEAAGQTISHVHFHIIPRVKDDLAEPDSIYDELEKPTNRLWTPEEMAVAANDMRPFVDKVVSERKVGSLTS